MFPLQHLRVFCCAYKYAQTLSQNFKKKLPLDKRFKKNIDMTKT